MLKKTFSLASDNHSGVHPLIFKAMADINSGSDRHAPSYGTDDVTKRAVQDFKTTFGPQTEAFFVFNGTAANVLCLRALIESYESVICAETAHLQNDECGAPEYAVGCKLLTIESHDGKITPEQIKPLLIRGGDQHYAQPRLVSITQCTEYGTTYSLDELRALRAFTREHKLLLHIDGARLVQAAAFLKCSLKEMTTDIGVDAVSFGGTKNGLLFGEAVLVFNQAHAEKLKYLRKQGMQLPSKMRYLSAQFSALFKNELWREISEETHSTAKYLAERLKEIPQIKVTQKTEANSVFAIIPKAWVKSIREHVFFYVWSEETYEVRLMISFDVTKNDIDFFIDRIKEAAKA